MNHYNVVYLNDFVVCLDLWESILAAGFRWIRRRWRCREWDDAWRPRWWRWWGDHPGLFNQCDHWTRWIDLRQRWRAGRRRPKRRLRFRRRRPRPGRSHHDQGGHLRPPGRSHSHRSLPPRLTILKVKPEQCRRKPRMNTNGHESAVVEAPWDLKIPGHGLVNPGGGVVRPRIARLYSCGFVSIRG